MKLNFEHPEEFKTLFQEKTRQVTDGIVSGISKAMESNRSSALLFEITFSGYDFSYEISLPKSQWSGALQSCLDYYHDIDATDECIDTWKLLEAAKLW